MRTLSDHTI